MENQTTLFDQCRTSDEIHAQLQYLVKELLSTIQQQTGGADTGLQTPGDSLRSTTGVCEIDLGLLSELSYADLKQHTHPVFLLSEICRLLFKLGDRKSLRHCLQLSHTIYSFQCQHSESWYISYLYKGIAQIGLKLTDLGIKNVSLGIAEHPDFPLALVDQALGYWALMSASILKRNLKLASTFAQKWHKAAQAGKLAGEMFRAKIVMHLFHLLLGELKPCSQDIKQLVFNAPQEWKDTLYFLEEWTRIMAGERIADVSSASSEVANISEPYPLLLGIHWCPFSHSELLANDEKDQENIPPGDFRFLCAMRRNFCREDTINNLALQDIEKYAACLAQWELPRPLYDFETILKHKALDKNLQYIMTRLLGKRILEAVIRKTPIEPDVVTQDQAIILVMDVRKFSALSEHRTPEEIFDILNPIFKMMNEELEQAGGTILEFVGDCIIIVFNTFNDRQTDILEILSRTIRCIRRIHVHNAMALQAGLPEIKIGVGINKGSVALGYLGGLARCHLTVLGNTINLASRIESSTKELPGDVIVSEFCFDNSVPDIWTYPWNVNFSVRDLGKHSMRNIKRPVHLFGLNPILRYWIDFVPMGFVARPEKGIVYIDTGNSGELGIIDHHYTGYMENSACELLVQKPELLLEHLEGIPSSQIEFRLHNTPDLDCAATLYTAYELLEKHPRTDILRKLAMYLSSIDQGYIPQPEQLSNSLYGLFIAHQKLAGERYGSQLTDFLLLEAGLRVVDAAVYLMEQHANSGDFSDIFHFQSDWFPEERRLITEDLARYHDDVQTRSHAYRARINGISEPATGLWIDHPQSIFFKLWSQNDPKAPGGKGYQFLTVNLSQPGKNRFIIRVDPESGTNLNGLGQLLEKYESEKRKKSGKERPIHPIRYPADNSDPWYFGQGHEYTIIDSPWEGTILTAEEVRQIHESWQGGNIY